MKLYSAEEMEAAVAEALEAQAVAHHDEMDALLRDAARAAAERVSMAPLFASTALGGPGPTPERHRDDWDTLELRHDEADERPTRAEL